MGVGNKFFCDLRPFDQARVARFQVLKESYFFKFFGMLDTVQVEMVKLFPAF